MPVITGLPPDLAPRALVCENGLPSVVSAATMKCSEYWCLGDVNRAIRCIEEAHAFARACHHSASESVLCIWMGDLYRETDRWGPALDCCQEAAKALGLLPGYQNKRHIEAVVVYLRGLLHCALGSRTKALVDYQRAIKAFGEAIKYWEDNRFRDPSRTQECSQQIDKCQHALSWINALCRCLADDLSLVDGAAAVHIPVVTGNGYGLLRAEPRGCLIPSEIDIDERRYRLYHPEDGMPFGTNLWLPWDARSFAVRVPRDRWAGPHSNEGDYVLAAWARGAVPPATGHAVVWNVDQKEWEYGRFVRDPGTGKIQFPPVAPIVIGGVPEEETVTWQDIGIVSALLKPA